MPNTLDLWPAAAAPLRERVQPAAGLDAGSRAQRAGGCARSAGVPQPGHFRPSTSGCLRARGLRAARRRQVERAGRVPAGGGRVADILQERANEFEGSLVTKGDCAKHWGRRNWMRQRAGALLRQGGSGPRRACRGHWCGQERGQSRGQQGRGRPGPSPRDKRGLGW